MLLFALHLYEFTRRNKETQYATQCPIFLTQSFQVTWRCDGAVTEVEVSKIEISRAATFRFDSVAGTMRHIGSLQVEGLSRKFCAFRH